MCAAGRPCPDVAAQYGLHPATVYKIVKGVVWLTTFGRQQAPQRPRVVSEPDPVAGARWVALTRDAFALIDERDFAAVSLRSWGLAIPTRGNTGYAYANDRDGRHVKLHRFVWSLHHPEIPPALDHRNLNGLDCRLDNLRPATDQQNHGNRALNKNSSTGFKGVSKSGPGYRAYIAIGRKQTHLGSFATPEDAARAYDDAAVESFGEFARLNFPRDGFPVAAVSK